MMQERTLPKPVSAEQALRAGRTAGALLVKLRERAERKGYEPGSPKYRSYVFGTLNREVARLQKRGPEK